MIVTCLRLLLFVVVRLLLGVELVQVLVGCQGLPLVHVRTRQCRVEIVRLYLALQL